MKLHIKFVSRDKNIYFLNVKKILKHLVKKIRNNKKRSYRQQRKKSQRFTTIKSPHAHKDAQTSFEHVLYKYHLKLESKQISKFLHYYKESCNSINLNLKSKIALKIKSSKKIHQKNLYFFKNKNFLQVYLVGLGFFGKQFFLQKFICLNSSVGRARD